MLPLLLAGSLIIGAGTGPDIRHTRLQIRPDLAGGRLYLTATLEISNPNRDTSFAFLLAAWYDRVSVRGAAGPAVLARDGETITVTVAHAVSRERLVFELSGAPGRSRGDDRPILADSSIYLLWSDRFYPCDFDDWTLITTDLTVPRGFTLLAPGRRVSAWNRGALHFERFATAQPVRAATVIADRRWIETRRTLGGILMRTLFYPAEQPLADSVLRTSADVIAFYASRFGPYPFDEYTFATVEGIFARRALAGAVIYAPDYLAQEMRATGRDAHETALLWWFWTVGGTGPGAYQWIEGFGDYAEMQYDEARGLPAPPDFERYRRGYLRTAGTDSELTITNPRGPLSGNFVHGRLPRLMQLLRFALGDRAYDRAVRHLFERRRHRSVTLEEFVATLSEGAGVPLDWWRDEWLLRRGVPEISWHADVTPDSAGALVRIAIRQASVYHVPIEIGIVSPSDTTIHRVMLSDTAQTFDLRAAGVPSRVLVDPRNRLLATIGER